VKYLFGHLGAGAEAGAKVTHRYYLSATCFVDERSLKSLNPDISQKYIMGDICKGVANELKPAKNIKK
jgi:hypothetical protein